MGGVTGGWNEDGRERGRVELKFSFEMRKPRQMMAEEQKSHKRWRISTGQLTPKFSRFFIFVLITATMKFSENMCILDK